MKVWENSKKLWKHSHAACVPTAFLVLLNFHSGFYLTNRFHVVVRLFSNRSQMTSKCGKRHSKINFVFGLVLLNCRLKLLEYFFCRVSHSVKKETPFSYFFLLLVPVQWLDKTFCTLFSASHVKILSYFSKLPAIFKCRRKNFVLKTSTVCLFSNRS